MTSLICEKIGYCTEKSLKRLMGGSRDIREELLPQAGKG